MQDQEQKFIIAGKLTVALTKNPDGFWQDDFGTLYAFKDGKTLDDKDRCGIAPLALPEWDFFQPLNDACKPHDFAFSSPVYEAFNTENEANQMLDTLLTVEGHPILGKLFQEISNLLGGFFWENGKTRI